ncbi:MAG: DDE-type integrase/transposase/recombinase [Spirochaetes bacterium]|nr:DDE-type integrase/transposase/recombinase [Spirochaetota bacterium]
MVKRGMYQEIKRLKILGRSKNRVSKELNIDIKTVRKYWHMNDEQYQKSLIEFSFREKEFEGLKTDILAVYEKNDFMKLNVAAIHDYLLELKGEVPAKENTLRNYIHYLVETGQLSLNKKSRYYTQVPDMPYGKQLQLDFGQYIDKNNRKYFIFAAVLSASRFKYAALQESPFSTKDLISHLLDCFGYLGGMPEELVIDQDCTMVVSENHGDIIYTRQFKELIEEMDLKMYVCRGADPESKGKIENVVKFIKYNFFPVREFQSLSQANESLMKWLERKANGRISQATKKIPLIEIETERLSLRPLRNSIFHKDMIGAREERVVNEKSRIAVDTSQYDVPNEYRNGSVDIYKTESKLFIFDRKSCQKIAEYTLSVIPGKIVSNKAMIRDMGTTAKSLKEEVKTYFELTEWEMFLEYNFTKFTRYVRDQCLQARKFFKDQHIDQEKLTQALSNCLENKSYSIKDLWDNYQYYFKSGLPEVLPKIDRIVNTKVNARHVLEVIKPDIGVYQNLCNTIGGQQ